MKIYFHKAKVDTCYNFKGKKICILPECGFITGGDTVLYTNKIINNEIRKFPILSSKKFERGIITVFASSVSFSNAIMKSTRVIPEGNLKQIFELEYEIFNSILEMKEISKNDTTFVPSRLLKPKI